MGGTTAHGHQDLIPGNLVPDFVAGRQLVLKEDCIIHALVQVDGEEDDESELKKLEGLLLAERWRKWKGKLNIVSEKKNNASFKEKHFC